MLEGVFEIPNAVQIAERFKDWRVWAIVAVYFLAGFALLYLVMRPKSQREWAALIGIGTLWNIY